MLLLTLLIALPALAFCQVDIQHLADLQFNRFDVDQDGNIEPLEVATYFRRFDTNQDQQISRIEYNKEVDTHHANDPPTHTVLLRLFDALDYNNDSHLSQSDFDALFVAADANKNHLVNQAEFRTVFYDLTGILPVGK
ncbi:calmodulin-like protein 5 isoform X2 [Biomphalaria glabrata]|nr:calmodulin-like protein 5 isoform X2 [Biomphalaria glabrata]KAI8791278.1 calmodulin protein 5 isoform X2 [Biomphalaria glabrata]